MTEYELGADGKVYPKRKRPDGAGFYVDFSDPHDYEAMRDGDKLRVPMFATDEEGVAMEQAKKEWFATRGIDPAALSITDGRPDGPRLNQPGSRYAEAKDDVQEAKRVTAYSEYEQSLKDSWRTPAPAPRPAEDEAPSQGSLAAYYRNAVATADARIKAATSYPNSEAEMKKQEEALTNNQTAQLEQARKNADAEHRAYLENAWRNA